MIVSNGRLAVEKEKYEYDKIAIGDNCFIGTRAFICKGFR